MKDKDTKGELATVDRVERWLPAAVVVSALIGFSVLAWYAYNAGVQSGKDEDLLVVEAEKTPLREKPADPGGMKFPNQDKTIFETFSGGSQTPPKVERVLPAPEEPVEKDSSNAETQTWINKNLHNEENLADSAVESIPQTDLKPHKAGSVDADPSKDDDVQVFTKKEEPITPEKKTEDKTPPNSWEAVAEKVKAQEEPANPVLLDEKKTAEKVPVKVVAEKAEQKPEQKAAAVAAPAAPAEKPAAKQAAKATGAYKVQLGAYRSDEEATREFTKIARKFPDAGSHAPQVIKADLGTKGIFYRLRLTGFASAADAKTFCATLSAKGQACMLPAE